MTSQTLQTQNSLTRSTLIQLSVWIGTVLVLSTLLSYMHVVSNLENQTLQHLQSYIAERGQRESQLFHQAQNRHQLFKQQLLTKLPEQDIVAALQDLLPIYGRVWTKDAHTLNFYAILNDGLQMGIYPQKSSEQVTTQLSPNTAQLQPTITNTQQLRKASLWSGFHYNEKTGGWNIRAATPVFMDNQTITTIGSELLLNHFIEDALQNRLEDSYNLIVAGDGQLIVHPKYMGAIKDSAASGFDVANSADAYLQEIYQNILEAPFIGKATVINHSHEGDYLAVTRIADLNWYFITVYPKAIVHHQAFVTAFFILILGSITLLTVIAVLSVVLRTQVAAPLNQLIEATQQIAEGNLNLQLDTQRHDELGQLAKAFNNMAREIESRVLGFKNIQKTLQQEILERKQMENALRASEERFTLAMQGSNDGIMDWHILSNSVYFSPRWKSIIGYADEELNNHFEIWQQHIYPEDREAVSDALEKYLKKHSASYEIAFRMRHKTGDLVWVLARGIALWNAAGQAVRLVATHADITPQKQAEKLLREYNEQLNQEVKLRTHEAETAWVEAERANRAKSIFLANMSHELRTPLNSISGYAQLLSRDTQLSANYREKIAIIQRSGDYLLTLINDILDLAKIEAGRVDIEPIEFDFNEFLQGINDLFYIRAEQKNITFRFEALTKLPAGLYADERRLRQILINLIGNAIKFTPEGQVVFKVGYEQANLRFQIEDTGVGIADTDKDKIFQPFQQTGGRNYQQQGTGLGLAITKKLVEMMGGELHFTSELRKGSTFWVRLALPETTTFTHTEIAAQRAIFGYEGARKQVLLVDNHPDSLLLMQDLLTPLGFDLLETHTGRQALKLAETNQPDLIFMELSLPNIDGYALAKYLKKSPPTAAIPLVALSASVFDYHQEAALDAGCSAFIAKPLAIDEVLNTLEVQLGLTWLYKPLELTEAQEEIALDSAAMATPTPREASILYDLAMRGDIAGIMEYAEQLAAEEPELIPFTQKIIQLAKNFADDQICELVAPYKL